VPEKRGTVAIAEREESDGTAGTVLTGLFDAYHSEAGTVLDEVEGLTADEAIAWGLERADEVEIRTADGDYHSAGPVDVHSYPTWAPDGPIRRRRRAGDEWRDRIEHDPAVPWLVLLDLLAPISASRPEANAFAEQAAARLGAPPPAPAPDWQDLEGMTFLLWGGDRAGPGPWQGPGYRIELELPAPTARRAMEEAVRRCGAPDGWAVSAYAKPLA
jgi:hypothetical protein